MKINRLFLALLSSLIIIFLAGSASANQSQNSITVNPAISQVQLTTTQDASTVKSSITNKTNLPFLIRISFKDFQPSGDDGTVNFYDNDDASDLHNHGLINNLSTDSPELILAPGEEKAISINIKNVSSLARGGHYAAVIYQASPPPTSLKGNQIAVNQSLTSLIFVSTLGQGVQDLKLEPVSTGKFWWRFPTSEKIVLTNTGNTQTVPRGTVIVYDNSNHEISKGMINIDSGLVLPDSSRLFNIVLRNESVELWPGIYHLSVSYHYDGSNNIKNFSSTILYINLPLIVVPLLIIVGAVVYLIRKKTFKRYLTK